MPTLLQERLLPTKQSVTIQHQPHLLSLLHPQEAQAVIHTNGKANLVVLVAGAIFLVLQQVHIKKGLLHKQLVTEEILHPALVAQ